jgi:hypothetical protein
MRPNCPEHCGDFFDRVCVDWYAAHDNDAPALLNLIEYPLKVMGGDNAPRGSGSTGGLYGGP